MQDSKVIEASLVIFDAVALALNSKILIIIFLIAAALYLKQPRK